MATEMFLKALGHTAAFAQEEHAKRESRRGPARSRQREQRCASPLHACPELKAFRAAIPHALPSPSALSCHRGFYQLREEGERDPGANSRGSPCLGQKGSSRMLESMVHGLLHTAELLMIMEGLAGAEQRRH